MIIQTTIDSNDVADAVRGTKRGAASAITRLAVCFLLLLPVSTYGLFSLYGAFSSFGRNVNGRFGAPFAQQAMGFAADLIPVFFNIFCLGLVALLWFYLYRAVKSARGRVAAAELKYGLSVGKQLIHLSETHLVVKTPLKAQKVAWAAFDRFEETKTSLIFHYAGGGFEFIPKDAISATVTMDTLCADLEQRIDAPLSRGGDETAALRLTYEFTQADNDEFRAWRRRERAKSLPLARRLVESPRAVGAAFVFCACLSAAALMGAVLRLDAFLLGPALLSAAVAAILALTHQAIFARVAARLRSPGAAPCGLTNPTTVTLSKTGVFRECRGASEVYQWEAFEDLVQTRSAAYLVLGADAALALPKRAFMDGAHYERFIGFATARIAKTKREKTSAQMNRLQKSAATPAAPQPNSQISHRSAAGRSDDSPAAPGDRSHRPIRAARAQ